MNFEVLMAVILLVIIITSATDAASLNNLTAKILFDNRGDSHDGSLLG
jgi:hypothetical protein